MSRPSVAAMFTTDAAGPSDPAVHQAEVTPSDTIALDPVPRALIVTVAGDVELTDWDGNTVLYSSVPAYFRFDLRVQFVGEATTATVVAWA